MLRTSRSSISTACDQQNRRLLESSGNIKIALDTGVVASEPLSTTRFEFPQTNDADVGNRPNRLNSAGARSGLPGPPIFHPWARAQEGCRMNNPVTSLC